MIEDSLQRVLERWKKAFGQHAALLAETEPSIMRWEWASGERYSPLPFYFNRFPGRGRLLKEPPASPGYYLRYGLDAQGRPRLHRFYEYLNLDDIQRFSQGRGRGFVRDDLRETFYVYTDTLVEIIEFSIPPRIPLKVQQVLYEAGRVIRSAAFRLNGYTPLYSKKGRDPEALYKWLGPNGRFKQVEQYIYDSRRLIRVLLYLEQPGALPFEAEDQFSYDEAGILQRIDRLFKDGPKQLLYRKREKGQTFQSMRDAAVRKMIAAIVERIRLEDDRERLCCIELSYQAAVHYFPPAIILGSENDRQKLLSSGRPETRSWVFAPAMMSNMAILEITDPETLEICSQLDQEIKAGEKWDLATGVLREVAAGLSRYEWGNFLDVTDDFVVFAIDWEMEGGDLADVLGASASKKQLQEWKKKGWL